MQILRLADMTPIAPPPATCVALGLFDGVHRAHAAVLRRAAALAAERALPLLVYTFSGHDAPKAGIPRLCEEEERLALLASHGAELCALDLFSTARHRPPEQFFHEVLRARLHAAVTVVGEDFRFGAGATGDAAMLARLQAAAGGEGVTVPAVCEGGTPISSTRIRTALAEGDVGTAASLLARPYTLTLPVVRGAALGRTLGLPTANQLLPEGRALPADGVYVTEVVTPDGARLRGVTDIGTRPTVNGGERRAETHILDYTGELYGAPLTVAFLARLRGEVAYPDLAALKAAIQHDIKEAREWKP